MRYYFTLFVLILAITFTVTAQQNNNTFVKPEPESFIDLEWKNLSTFQSNPLFYNYFVLLQYQNKNVFDEIMKLKGTQTFANMIEADIRAGIIINKKKCLGLSFNVSTFNYQVLNTSADLCRLFLMGNADFTGKKVLLSPTNMEVEGWQNFGMGLYRFRHTKTGKKLDYGIGINYMNLSPITTIYINDGYLYTSQEGDSINMALQADFAQSIRKNLLFLQSSGWGLNINAFLKLAIHKKHSIQFKFSELGFAHYQSKEFDIETDFLFSGIDLFNGQKIEETSLPLHLADSLLQDSIDYLIRNKLSYPRISIEYQFSMNDRLGLFSDIEYLPEKFLKPMINVGFNFNLYKNLNVSAGYVNDIFGKPGLTLHAAFINETTEIKIGTYHFQGLIPGNYTGQSMRISFIKRW